MSALVSEPLPSPPHGHKILHRRQFFFWWSQNRSSRPQIQSWLLEPSHMPSPLIHIRTTYPVHSTLRGKGCERSEQLGDKSIFNSFLFLTRYAWLGCHYGGGGGNFSKVERLAPKFVGDKIWTHNQSAAQERKKEMGFGWALLEDTGVFWCLTFPSGVCNANTRCQAELRLLILIQGVRGRLNPCH